MCSVLPKQNSRHDLGGVYDCIKASNVNPFPHQRSTLKACWPDMPYICWGEHWPEREIKKVILRDREKRERERDRDRETETEREREMQTHINIQVFRL